MDIQHLTPTTHPPLSLALCITDLDVGGAERCLTELATRVDRTRYKPTVYCLQPLPSGNDLLDRLSSADVDVCSTNARRSLDGIATIALLANEFSRRKTDVVQSFLFHANIVGRLAARKAGIRKIFCSIRVAESQRRWRLWADWATDRPVSRHICVSQDVANFATWQGKLPRSKLTVIPNGVDAAKFSAASPADLAECGFRPNRRSVIFIGRLERQKRVDWLLRSAVHWMPQLDDIDLMIVGAGRERDALMALSEKTWTIAREFILSVGGRIFRSY